MFLSTYVPVNMHRINCAVYSNEKSFPEEKLLLAYALVNGKNAEGVYMSDGSVMFIDDPTIHWTLPEIYLAYEAYNQALKSNFSYYAAKDKTGIPQLYISKSFRGHRLLVNAFSMHTILLGNQQLVAKAASLIDKTLDNRESVDLFNTMSAIESGSSKFLSACIVYRDTPEEYMAVSPIMTPGATINTMYGSEEMEEIIHLYNGKEPLPEFSYERTPNGDFHRTDVNVDNILTCDVARYLVDVYNRTKEKKSNYVELRNDDFVVEMYLSTNHRYLVNARTFECVVIKNQHVKSLLTAYAKQYTIPSDQLQLAWMLAKTE